MKRRKRGLLPDVFGAYILNNAQVEGKYDLPLVGYFGDEFPDYIALYTNLFEYHKTKNTAVAFFQYDEQFDSINSIWNAICLKKEKLLRKYKERFKNIQFVICPDYSITGDMPKAMQIFNIYRSRIVGIWLRDYCGCTLIPNLRFNNSNSYDFCFDGIAYGSVVCLSILGLCAKKEDVCNLKNGLHEAIKRIRPKTIILYGECEQKKYFSIFSEVINEKIPIIKPLSNYSVFWRKLHGITK